MPDSIHGYAREEDVRMTIKGEKFLFSFETNSQIEEGAVKKGDIEIISGGKKEKIFDVEFIKYTRKNSHKNPPDSAIFVILDKSCGITSKKIYGADICITNIRNGSSTDFLSKFKYI